jgi:hypothetical protein
LLIVFEATALRVAIAASRTLSGCGLNRATETVTASTSPSPITAAPIGPDAAKPLTYNPPHHDHRAKKQRETDNAPKSKWIA